VFVQPEVCYSPHPSNKSLHCRVKRCQPHDIDWLFHHTAAAAASMMNGAENHSWN